MIVRRLLPPFCPTTHIPRASVMILLHFVAFILYTDVCLPPRVPSHTFVVLGRILPPRFALHHLCTSSVTAENNKHNMLLLLHLYSYKRKCINVNERGIEFRVSSVAPYHTIMCLFLDTCSEFRTMPSSSTMLFSFLIALWSRLSSFGRCCIENIYRELLFV